MNLIEYLRERHEFVNALTMSEAKIIGISYPLIRGWVGKYGSLELPDDIVIKLKKARADRYSKVAENKAKKKKKNASPNPLNMTKAQKKELGYEISNLVKKIISNGCKDNDRMLEHLSRIKE